jgi:post-segregation antitoxin (ccd killing protein)
MADSPCFERACQILERETAFDRLEARGTIRLTLKAAGLDARSVTSAQMEVAVDKLLGDELEARGIENSAAVCTALKQEVARIEAPDHAEAPEAVFARLGGG